VLFRSDVIIGQLSDSSGVWHIITIDYTKSTETELDISGDTAAYNWASNTLEGYSINSCSQLSEGTHFYNLYLTSSTGQVSPSWTAQNNYSGNCGLNPRVIDSTDAILNTSDPYWTTVYYSSPIQLGQSDQITLDVENLGGPDSWQTDHLGFPDPVAAAPVITSTDLASSNVFAPGYNAAHDGCYSWCTVTTSYYFAEGSSPFSTGTTHYLTVSVTPKNSGTFHVYLKTVASATDKAGSWNPNSASTPPSGTTLGQDEQSEYVIVLPITVNAPFTYSLSNSGGITVTQGSSSSNTITATLQTGTSQSVTLSCTGGLPSGASCGFNPGSGSPTFSSTLTISTTGSTPTGGYTITVNGNPSATAPTQFALTVNSLPQLSVNPVTPPSPPNGGTVSSSSVKFKVQVTNNGVAVKGASVTVYVDGSPVSGCSSLSNLSGYFVCSFSLTQSGHTYSWYATASKSGYVPGTSSTWTCTYASLMVSLLQPSDGATVVCPVKLVVKVTYQGAVVSGATISYYVDGTLVGSKVTNTYGKATFSFCPSPGAHSWYVTVQSTYGSATSPTRSFSV
jgi:hypothetical protein